ncbi:hypothetical protein Cni_G19557 [Canna indica]|uniref:Centromere protein C n=1 Tax=Canna indica TaxID=4628 RepID=A0AAQ3QIR0_9LILI|nr:hypothetical protein Cni_G19557 [Canna indica]
MTSRSSEYDDPFAGFSLLPLLPRTLGVALHAETPLPEAQEMKSVIHLLDSIVLSGSKDAVEQAQTINSCPQNVVISPQEGEKTIPEDGKDRLPGRRPALGRKRAQFSLKPIPSNPIPDIDFNSEIDHLVDPEEYFMAFEQLDIADKELKKLRGEVPTQYANNQRIIGRKCRPGILRKTSSYKHQFSTPLDLNDSLSASQDLGVASAPSKVSISSKSNESLNSNSFGEAFNLDSMRTDIKVFVATEQEDSVAENEKNSSNILEKLLSSFKDLDEAEGTALLKERLQIKSFQIGKICLPEPQTIQKNDSRVLNDRVVRKSIEAQQLPRSSPTTVRSPLGAILNLQRCISVNDPLENPYMFFPSDGAPYGGDSSPATYQQKKSLSHPVGAHYPDPSDLLGRDTSMPAMPDDIRLNLVDKLQTPAIRSDKTIKDKIAAEEMGTTVYACQSPESSTGDKYLKMTNDQITYEGFNKEIEDKAEQIQLEQLDGRPDLTSGCNNNSCKNGFASTLESDEDMNSGRDNANTCNFDDNLKSCILESDEDMNSGRDNANTCNFDDNLKAQVNAGAPCMLPDGSELYMENSNHTTTILASNEQSNRVNRLIGENVEKHGYATSAISQNNEKKKKASPRSKNKKLRKLVSKRQSLAGVGMEWKSGLRRSTRIKHRPLEYWRGERLLYGRIHDSLATVIGVKYASPGKDDVLTVKSYVSDQFADLVTQAALH